jgi:hypothetical protein
MKRSKSIPNIILIGLSLLLIQANSLGSTDYRDAINKNVCKDLKGTVLVYFIFVDTKETAPWTEFDIRSTIDSMAVATRWLNAQASKQGIDLIVRTDYYIGPEFATIRRNLPRGTVEKTALNPSFRKGLGELNLWADGIARLAGRHFNLQDKDGIPEIKNPRNKERLVAYLRDEYNVESVALLYMVNNYYKTDISIPVNTMNTNDVEFSVVSYKYPSEIAHNILHLFGAADLHKTPYRRHEKKIRLAQESFPRDVMQDPYGKNIWDLEIGNYTRYLIGWANTLDEKFSPLLTDRSRNFD